VYAWGRSSPSFDIVGVRVAGTHLVREKRVHRLLQKEFAGSNLFTVTAGDVRSSLSQVCFVSGVSIDRDFPDALDVTVSEYAPAAYAMTGDRWYVLDEHGHVICTASQAAEQVPGGSPASAKPSPSPSPTATATPVSATATPAPGAGETAAATAAGGSTLERLLAGPADAALQLPRVAASGSLREGSSVQDEAVLEMLEVITALPRSLRRRLAVVENDAGQLTLRFTGGPVATWGDTERSLAKTVALRTVLSRYEAAGKTCTQLDVSIPDRSLAKPVLK
jgi:cell division septal protein FtsQ